MWEMKAVVVPVVTGPLAVPLVKRTLTSKISVQNSTVLVTAVMN